MSKRAAAAKISGQSVKVFDEDGKTICIIPAARATGAVASGDSIAITFEEGNIKIYDPTGRCRSNLPK